jgi:hypothetical protein|tara:strand:- start:762 stop:872 length:111 start_codon:yes stop_codon:yes gene_type:complete
MKKTKLIGISILGWIGILVTVAVYVITVISLIKLIQ